VTSILLAGNLLPQWVPPETTASAADDGDVLHLDLAGVLAVHLDPRVTEGFADLTRDNPTLFRIEGHSGTNVGPFTAARSEAEILFRGGVEFRVLENFVDANGVRHLHIEEIR
jgi:hypothetical protein